MVRGGGGGRGGRKNSEWVEARRMVRERGRGGR